MSKDWIEVRNRINKELGNDKPSILSNFTILPYDFYFDEKGGRLNVQFIDEELVINIAQKYNLYDAILALTKVIAINLNDLVFDITIYNQQTVMKIQAMIHEEFRNCGYLYGDSFMIFLNDLREELYRGNRLSKKNIL